MDYQPEYTTVWSFPQRGDWATHNPHYRGNFAPQIARNIIKMYSAKGENILDPMVGGGTMLIESKLLGRNALGVDINPKAIEICKKALQFNHHPKTKQVAKLGDARNLSVLKNDSVDLILTHPPYLNIIKYSDGKIDGDISNIGSLTKFCDEIEIVANELYRVLKPNKFCAILIGDTRKSKHFVPIAYNVMQRFFKAGFILKEDIVKVQHNCTMTNRWKWKAEKDKFYLIMHEHLFVFRKPAKEEDITKVKFSH